MKTFISKKFRPSRLLLIALFSFSQILGILSPAPVSAAANADKIMLYEALKGLIGTCAGEAGTGGLYLRTELSNDQFADDSYSPIKSDGNINVPSLLFSTTSITCAKALSLYYGAKFDGDNLKAKRVAFLRKYYDTTTNPPFNLKENEYTTAAELAKDIRSYANSLVGSDVTEFNAWRDRIISKDFNDCWKWKPENAANTPIDISQATEAQKKNPNNWAIQDHDTESNKVGWMAEKEITGSYIDGLVSCDEVKKYVLSDHVDLIGYGDNDLQDDLQDEAKAAAAAEIGKILYEGDNANKVAYCAASAGIPIDPPLNLYDVATWLAYNDDDHKLPVTGGDLNKFKSCLIEAIPEIKTTLEDLKQDLSDIEKDIVAGEGGGGDTTNDNCLKNTDQFIGWFACPVINIIDSVLEKIEDIIQSLLKFDLDKQNKNDGLKDAWNIFRALATILIIAGFLLALLVKGVKGE